MNKDIRAAMLGDHEAAKRLTDAGVLLPCPWCGETPKVTTFDRVIVYECACGETKAYPGEGIEREWGWRCSKCKVVLPDDFDDPDNPPAMRFCQWCGAPMTDEAVQMVMERLGALYGET